MVNNYSLKSDGYNHGGRVRLSKCQGHWQLLAISVNYEYRSKGSQIGVRGALVSRFSLPDQSILNQSGVPVFPVLTNSLVKTASVASVILS